AHGGIGFSPFGIDDNGSGDAKEETAKRLRPFAQQYTVLAPMLPQLAQWAFDGKIKSVAEREDHANQTVDLGSWQAEVSFGTGERMELQTNPETDGKLMIAQLSENKFVLIGARCHVV